METFLRQSAVECEETERNTEAKENTVNQSDSGCETSTTKSTDETLTSIDILVLKRDPQTNRKQINKTAYAKLQRSLSPTRNSQLTSLKSKYEKSDNENEISKNESVPSEFKLNQSELALTRPKSKLPVPTPRNGVKSEIIAPSQKLSEKYKNRHSLMVDKKTKKRDENSNEVFRKSSSSSGEFITIIPRSESIETIDKLEKELNLFTMDKKPKDKKRNNSFRKIFTAKIFSKEKKKKQEPDSVLQQKTNVHTDNIQNENNFTRRSPHRTSIQNCNIPKPITQDIHRRIPPPNINMEEIERRYAQMHVKEFNNIKQNFENQPNLPETDQIPTLSPGPMDFSKVSNISKFIDTSSSASMDSDKDSSSRTLTNQDNPYKSLRFADHQRDTPPRAQELRHNQDVRLVNPKALIPINSERPLPNPYQNAKPVISPKPQINPFNPNLAVHSSSPKPRKVQQLDFNSEKPSSSNDESFGPVLNETYGTVFDNVDSRKDLWVKKQPPNLIQKPPRSPSLEPSKLKLPTNRDIGPMSPRMRSPIPQHHISTEKLIATELLRTSRSPTPTKKKINQFSSSHQKLDTNFDYPDNASIQKSEHTRTKPLLATKPPISRVAEVNNQKNGFANETKTHSKIPENINYQDSEVSPNYENKIHQSRHPGNINLQGSVQKLPNYDNRTNQPSPISRASDIAILQRNSPVSPNYENRSYQSSPISRESMNSNFQRNSQLSPSNENRNYQASSISRDYINTSLQRNSQVSPNYENRPHKSSPMSRVSDTASLQRNRGLSPNYEYRNQQHSSSSRDQFPNYENSYYQRSPLVGSQERIMVNNAVNNNVVRSPTPNSLLQNAELSLRPQSSRSSTPIDQRISQSSQTPSPNKEEIRKSVEAYYWKEIKKLKEQENNDLYYYQMQMMPFGYAEDPVNFRRSRSSSPSSQRNGRRSLSLPREPKSQIANVQFDDDYGRYQPAPIPEGRAVVNYPDSIYYQQNFRRNVPERRTIDTVHRSNGNTIYRPIFKRGSLTTPSRELIDDQQQKKVSFNKGKEKEIWPTKNGYTQSPPQRRLESNRPDSMEDDVFLPVQQPTSRLIVDGKEIYGYTNRSYDNQIPYYQNANFYKQIHQEPIYSPRNHQAEDTSRIPVGMTRYNSMQLVDPTYDPHQRVSRRMSFDNSQGYISKPQIQQYNMPRRQIYLKDDIYGYFGGYVPKDQQQNVVYSSRQNIADPNYGFKRDVVKQGTVRDKVCDIYGQIHDRDSPSLNVRKSGVMIGQLQPAQNSYSQLPNQNFVRNSRLTASANDMYRRYQNVEPRYYDRYQAQQSDRPPSRPLPPVPADKKLYYRQNPDSIKEFSDVQKPSSLGKNKKRGIFGQTEQTSAKRDNNSSNLNERQILLEQLKLLKRQQVLEVNKRQWQQYRHQISPEERKYQQHWETEKTEELSMIDLRKLVLLEELKLIRLKIKIEMNVK